MPLRSKCFFTSVKVHRPNGDRTGHPRSLDALILLLAIRLSRDAPGPIGKSLSLSHVGL